ncbi:MAG: glycoside hydrolase family 3 N-terminal domain-containing protein [Lachnospiraceae bacterium]|nr:glycoside hydrolase family 3 N-terminal domain-containing protein [Lachnospiraceae bacterium]
MKTIWKNKTSRIWLIVTAIILVFTITVNLVLTQWLLVRKTLDQVFGGPVAEAVGDSQVLYTNSTSSDGLEYYKVGDGINEKTDALNASNELTVTICEEGSVLLKNENNALPLAGNETISVFGKNSVNLVYGGSGSASSDRTGAKTIYESLEEAGFQVNETLKEFYENDSLSGSKRAGNPSMESGVPTGIEISETPIDSYTDEVQNSFEGSNVALVVLSRISGEGWDLPRTMMDKEGNPISGAMSAEDHYLEMDQNEQDMLEYACENFEKVIVIVNSSNTMELGFLDDVDDGDKTTSGYDFASHIDGALWIGGVGNYGIMALGHILNGSVNPSGRTVDTYVRDFSKDPSWQNFSTNLGSTDKKADGGTGNSYYVDSTDRSGAYVGKYTGDFYVEYEEGIYVGYRYYETAAEEGYIDYEEAVVYPFGYGLSYTTFDQTFDSLEQKTDESGNTYYEAAVTVINTGSMAGKDVVQLYYTAPYITGEIEKAHVVLGAYEKTGLLEAGESETVMLTVYEQDMASYDYSDANKNDHKGYELDEGDYEFKIMKNSHELIDSKTVAIAAANYDTDRQTGAAVENRFDDVSEEMTGKVMSRADFSGTFPTTPTYEARRVEQSFIDEISAPFADTNDENMTYYTAEYPTQDSEVTIQLRDLVGLEKDDPKWETFMDQMSVYDMATLIGTGCYNTQAFEKYGIPKTIHGDGPVGFVDFLKSDIAKDKEVCGYASECVLGSTWNKRLAYEMGIAYGNEALFGDGVQSYSGWYAPGVNIHRSAFGGRNPEYFSEDGLLSGWMAAYEVQGATEKGCYTMVKHFALNEQETNRNSNGILTWADEQTMRELYLVPFKYTVQEGKTTGIMSSFNRIGKTWAGGSYALCTEVLRNEWGFDGMVISDFNANTTYMYADMMIRAGGDLNLCQDGLPSTSEDKLTATQASVIRTAAKNILYVTANSNAMNGDYTYGLAPWEKVMYLVDAVLAILLILWGILAIHKAKRVKLETVEVLK